jgi:hypothetical protein
MHIRPIEWGVSSPNPKANIKAEVRRGGDVHTQGWYSECGSKEYSELVVSDYPIKIATYGNLALNVILQVRDEVAQPHLSRQVGICAPGARCVWITPQPIPMDQFAWIPDLRIIQPCTLMTYNYRDNVVYAPCYLLSQLPFGYINILSGIQGQPIGSAGLLISGVAFRSSHFELPASSLPKAFGGLNISPNQT